MSEWKVMLNVNFYQVWRQTRPLRPGEPMHSGVRETRGYFETDFYGAVMIERYHK